MSEEVNQVWQNRIIKRSREKINRFARNKFNPKSHGRIQMERLKAVLDKFGQVGEIYVWQSARNKGQWTIFDGHAREELDPEQEWDIAWTSLTDQEIDELVLYYDPIAALARQEADRTMALMADLDVQERALREMLEEQARGLGFAFAKGNGDWDDALGGLPSGDRAPFQQMTFTLHDEQVEEVKRALALAKRTGDFADSPNQNSNGNALAFVCEIFITTVGDGQG